MIKKFFIEVDVRKQSEVQQNPRTDIIFTSVISFTSHFAEHLLNDTQMTTQIFQL